MEKLNELSLGEKVAGISGILLLLFSFFTWFKKDYSAGSFSGTYNGHSGWGGPLSLLGILLTIVIVVALLLARFGVITLPEKLGNFTFPQVFLAGAGLAFVLILAQVLLGQKVSGQSLDRSFWAWLGLLASLGVAVGAFLNFREAETTSGPSA